MKSALNYFKEICSIPHGSGNTTKIADYIEGFARERSLEYYRDNDNNIVIVKPAAKGRENDSAVMIQGHVDMVAEKDAGVDFNFETDGLRLRENGDFLYAEGTTLGADDGVAVALMLALLDDENLSAPRLECVFTVDEEIGLLGAASIDLSMCKAKYLINADSETEGEFICGCCGGSQVSFTLPVKREKKKGKFYNIALSGLKGGHSGNEINKGRLNAIILMSKLLSPEDGIVSIERDGKDNAIPARCDVVAAVDEKTLISRFEEYKNEWLKVEEGITLTVTPAEMDEAYVLDSDSAEKVINLLSNLPFGVQKMCKEPAGLVHTSDNLGIILSDDEKIEGVISVRSAEDNDKMELIERIKAMVKNAGGDSDVHGVYPGWAYKTESELRPLMVDTYKEITGKNATVEVIHAGLECGVLLEKMPWLDIVSMGCDIYDIHCPRERLSISSFENMVAFVRVVLAKIH